MDETAATNGGPWRFQVSPAGRVFLWQGKAHASSRDGILEVGDRAFATALRTLAKRDQIQELG